MRLNTFLAALFYFSGYATGAILISWILSRQACQVISNPHCVRGVISRMRWKESWCAIGAISASCAHYCPHPEPWSIYLVLNFPTILLGGASSPIHPIKRHAEYRQPPCGGPERDSQICKSQPGSILSHSSEQADPNPTPLYRSWNTHGVICPL